MKLILSSLLWLDEQELATITDDSLFDNHDFSIRKTHFFVTEQMLDLLTTLEISAELDDAIAYEDLKAAYKACCLKTHPDKPHGSKENFLKVKNTYDDLLEMIKAINDPWGLGETLDRYLQEMDENFIINLINVTKRSKNLIRVLIST